ncbi:MAG: efflux RND transporter periplasmic adaptor subunit [Chloroflexi bacterium]|nr:efflux RND transporter periplasmic adaptor subunit [Chloroflexota bacterium]
MARPKRKSRRYLWLGALIVAMLAIAGGVYYYQAVVPQATAKIAANTPKTTKVKKGDITITATGTANLIPVAQVGLSFRSGGRIIEIKVTAGDTVQAGQILARLDDTDARAQIAKAQLDVALAETKLTALTTINPLDIAAALADLQKAAVNLKHAQEAYDPVAWREDVGMLPQSVALEQASLDYQKAKTAYDLKVQGAKATDLQTAQLQIDQAKATLASAQTTLDNLTLKAPRVGMISEVKAEVGEVVGTAPVVTLMDVSKSWAQIAIDETDLSKVALGYPVDVTFDALPEQTFQGAIVQVSPSVVVVGGVSTLYAVAELKNPSPLLKVGMSGSAKITAASAKQVLTVPIEAVRPMGAGQYAVFVVDAAQQLELRPVEIGLKGTSLVEIKSGLQLGETVSTGTVATQ